MSVSSFAGPVGVSELELHGGGGLLMLAREEDDETRLEPGISGTMRGMHLCPGHTFAGPQPRRAE